MRLQRENRQTHCGKVAACVLDAQLLTAKENFKWHHSRDFGSHVVLYKAAVAKAVHKIKMRAIHALEEFILAE